MSRFKKRTLRAMQIASDYCDFDLENRIATITVRFDSAQELYQHNQKRGDTCAPSQELVDLLHNVSKKIPKEFDIGFNLQIKDMQGKSKEDLQEVCKKAYAIKSFSTVQDNKNLKWFWITAAIFGFLIIVIKVILRQNQVFGPVDAAFSVACISFIEILSELYFEESVIFFFIHRSRLNIFKEKHERIRTITVN
ncbi:MAG: hypothetical protein MJ189_00230 [Coriobacteriales bacterium]|nr:hypothetical protein [Coriobacteriales bacterium]